jgi:hypothetical protein
MRGEGADREWYRRTYVVDYLDGVADLEGKEMKGSIW